MVERQYVMSTCVGVAAYLFSILGGTLLSYSIFTVYVTVAQPLLGFETHLVSGVGDLALLALVLHLSALVVAGYIAARHFPEHRLKRIVAIGLALYSLFWSYDLVVNHHHAYPNWIRVFDQWAVFPMLYIGAMLGSRHPIPRPRYDDP